MNFSVVLRILIGGLFVVSGFEKLVSPYQNFLYVVQSYRVFPPFLEELVARFLPWGEFLLGIFVVLGLWLTVTLRALWVLVTVFLLVVGQAIIRKLELTECGCFGSLVSFPLHAVAILDGLLWVGIGFLNFTSKRTSDFSLDRYFTNQK